MPIYKPDFSAPPQPSTSPNPSASGGGLKLSPSSLAEMASFTLPLFACRDGQLYSPPPRLQRWPALHSPSSLAEMASFTLPLFACEEGAGGRSSGGLRSRSSYKFPCLQVKSFVSIC